MSDQHSSQRVVSAGTITGEQVRNPSGEDLGKIEEIVLDADSGQIAYAVLSFGGFLGMGDKLFAIPWQSLSFNDEADDFVLNVDREVLKDAPGFDKDNWPDFADRTWGSSIHSHYGTDPYWNSK